MTLAPLGRVLVHALHVERDHSALVLVCDESPELREWLWGTSGVFKGKAMGKRFRLVIDGVVIEARRVFARPCQSGPGVYVTLTTGPADTRAAAIGRRVGQVAHEVTLTRQSAAKGQWELRAKTEGERRVTVEVQNLLPDNASEATLSP